MLPGVEGGGGVEADYDTTVDKAGEGSQKPTSQATIVRTLTQLNHVARDTVSAQQVKFTRQFVLTQV